MTLTTDQIETKLDEQAELNRHLIQELRLIHEKLAQLSSEAAAKPQSRTLRGNEFQFQDLGEGELFRWQGHTWKKTGGNHAECQEPFVQFVPSHDVVEPTSEPEGLDTPEGFEDLERPMNDVESESRFAEGEASGEDCTADAESADA